MKPVEKSLSHIPHALENLSQVLLELEVQLESSVILKPLSSKDHIETIGS